MKIIFIITIYASLIFTETINIKYDISFSFFGKIGEAKLKIILDKNRYSIYIKAYFTGFYTKLFKNLKEQYISIGTIENDIYSSHKYIMIKSKNNKREITRFIINHKKRTVKKIYKEYKKQKLILSKNTFLPKDRYSTQDMLNVFFNINSFFRKNQRYKYNIIGTENKHNFQILTPSKKIINNYSLFKSKNFSKYIHIILNKKIFLSKKGEIIAGLSNKDNFLETAIIKDIFLIGDISIKRID